MLKGKSEWRTQKRYLTDMNNMEFEILEKEDDAVVCRLNFNEDYEHFQGHFPEMKLLPAVSQFDWAMRILRDQLGINTSLAKIQRLKFMAPIFPGVDVKIKLSYSKEKQSISFSLTDMNEEQKFSSGRAKLGELNG